MEVNFPITSKKRFAIAFYYAAKAYVAHRYNVDVDDGYFSDALYHYYFHITTEMKDNMISFDRCINKINYFVNTPVKGRIRMQNLTLRFNNSDKNILSLENFILSLILRGNIAFPPLTKLKVFPRQPNRIEYPFDEQQKLQYPDSKLVKHLSFDIEFLRNWLSDPDVNEEEKYVFIYGYDSGIQKTLSTFVESLHPEFMDPAIYDSIKGDVIPPLLQYLKTGVKSPDISHTYGTYQLIQLNFSSLFNVNSSMRFPNTDPKILPNEAIPEIRLPPLDLSKSVVLGQGGYGTVYQSADDEQFVYKLFVDREAFEAEHEGLSYLNRYMDNFTNLSRVVCYDSSKLMFKMMKLIPLPTKGNPFLPMNGNMPIFLQIVMGLYSMHSSGIAHNDIKFPNIMQTPDGNVQIIDFGLATVHCNKVDDFVYGTYIYNPPELCVPNRRKYMFLEDPNIIMPAHDIWSTCIVMYEMLLGRPIYHFFDSNFDFRVIVNELSIKLGNENTYELQRNNNIRIEMQSMRNLYDLIGDDEDLRTLLKSCLDDNPFRRATALEILTSDYAKRYIPNFIPHDMDPCYRRNLIDGNAFAGYRTKEERENWIRFCYTFKVFAVEYATYFEYPRLPKSLTYIDYVAILGVARGNRQAEFKFMQLPHPIPLTDGFDYRVTLEKRVVEYERLLRGVPKLAVNSNHRNYDEMKKILTRAYLDGKCADMSVSEILAE